MRPTAGRAAVLALVLVATACASHPRASGAAPGSAGPTASGKIAFSGGDGAIHVVNVDGTNLTRLTSGLGEDLSPAWSPDGTEIAFCRNGRGIYVMHADGTGLTRLTENPSDCGPTWSPDGTKIAYFRSSKLSVSHIFAMNSDGSGQVALTHGPASDWVPAWSPVGATIAFERHPSAEESDIYLMNADGSNATRLTSGPLIEYHNPAWSPDGTRIALWVRSKADAIEVLDAYSGTRTNLVSDTDRELGSGEFCGAVPTWSPDGRRLAWAGCGLASAAQTTELYIVNADGTGLTTVPNVVDASWPAWQPEVAA